MFGLNPYLIIGGMMSVIAAFGGGYVKGRVDRGRLDQTVALKVELDAQKQLVEQALRRIEDTTAALDAANQGQRAAEDARLSLQEKVKEYVDFASRQKRSCTLTDDDTRRLRGLDVPLPPRRPGGHPVDAGATRAPGAGPPS